MRKKAARIAFWLTPPAICFGLNWPAFRSWFQQDDFAWLGLSLTVEKAGDLPRALFAPMAQGTIRPISERLFFLAGQALFGPWAAPYHAAVMLTQLAAIALLAAVALRLTGSRGVAFCAAALWAVNGALTVPLAWVSAYNQALCALLMLAALYSLIRASEGGGARWRASEWAAFLLGLGSLETMVVYPAVALAWAWCFDRRCMRRTAPFFAVAVAYAALHFIVAPLTSSDPGYALHLDASMARTLARYFHIALGPSGISLLAPFIPKAVLICVSAGLLAGLAAFLWRDFRTGKRAGVFGMAWFVLTLVPVLPLRDHVFNYYVVVPAAGLALAAAAALRAAYCAGWGLPAGLLVSIYVACGVVEASASGRILRDRSFQVRTIVLGAYRARQLYPGKAIVLTGLTPDLYWASFANEPFRVFGLDNVYLDPRNAARIPVQPGRREPAEFVLPPEVLSGVLDAGNAVVYAVEPLRLRGITLTYTVQARGDWRAGDSRRVDAGNPLFAGQLGPAWHTSEGNRRWMPGKATLRLGGPMGLDEALYIEGWCPAEQLADGPLKLHVAADGLPLPDATLRESGKFRVRLKLPPELVGRPSVELTVAVDRTFRATGDKRDLGLIFGVFEIRR